MKLFVFAVLCFWWLFSVFTNSETKISDGLMWIGVFLTTIAAFGIAQEVWG